jgi:hypothetical protein
MRVELLLPDEPPTSASSQGVDDSAFAHALDALGGVLNAAQSAEDSFANGVGTLQDAAYERARADVAISVATSEAQHVAQAVTSILNMQV